MAANPNGGLRRRLEIDVSIKTIVRLLTTALLVWAGLRLWPELILILISVLIAVTMHPAIEWLERHRVSAPVAVLLIGCTFFAVLVAAAMFIMPSLAEQLSYLMQNLPRYRQNVQRYLPASSPLLQKIVLQVFELPGSPAALKFMAQPLVWGRIAIEAVTGFVLVIILSLYFLLDGKRLYAWLLAYVPREHRMRIAETACEVEKVVYAYMLGQVVTSLLCTVYTYVVLTALDVPAAMPLALLAGVCDVIPLVGMVISTVPAVLLAIPVSPAAGAIVLAAYLGYHAIETYVLVPRIYGKRLRLSTLAVLIALIIGGSLQGIVGAILVLPLVAAYPVIERIWLREYLGSDVVADHRSLAHAAEIGSDHAVDAVLRGEKTGSIPTQGADARPIRPVPVP